MTKWIPLDRDERARAIAETSGRRGSDPETMIAVDVDDPTFIVLSTTRGVDAAAVLRRGVGTHIARSYYDGEPHEWVIRVPVSQFRGWGGAFRPRWDEATIKRPAGWSRGVDVLAMAGDEGGEE